MVNFALGMGKGIKQGDVVRLSANESAKPLYIAICNAIVDAGGHVLSHYAPDEEKGTCAAMKVRAGISISTLRTNK